MFCCFFTYFFFLLRFAFGTGTNVRLCSAHQLSFLISLLLNIRFLIIFLELIVASFPICVLFFASPLLFLAPFRALVFVFMFVFVCCRFRSFVRSFVLDPAVRRLERPRCQKGALRDYRHHFETKRWRSRCRGERKQHQQPAGKPKQCWS